MDLKYFTGVGWALYSSKGPDWSKGRAAVRAKYGEEGWQRIRMKVKEVPSMVSLLKVVPFTPELQLFTDTVAASADHRVWKERQQTSTKKGK